MAHVWHSSSVPSHLPTSFLDRFCSPDDAPARAVASHALSVIFSDIASEREFTYARRALLPIWDDIRLLSLGAADAVLDLQEEDDPASAPATSKDRDRHQLLVTLERISRTELVPEAEGLEGHCSIAHSRAIRPVPDPAQIRHRGDWCAWRDSNPRPMASEAVKLQLGQWIAGRAG